MFFGAHSQHAPFLFYFEPVFDSILYSETALYGLPSSVYGCRSPGDGTLKPPGDNGSARLGRENRFCQSVVDSLTGSLYHLAIEPPPLPIEVCYSAAERPSHRFIVPAPLGP